MNGRLMLIKKIAKTSIFLNILLSGIKILMGFVGNSHGLLADGIHSMSDIASTIIVWIGLKISIKPEDEEHPYGHEKFEPVVASILSLILFLTAIGIGYKGIISIIQGKFIEPGFITIVVACISVCIKEWMYWYTLKASYKIDSSALKADAWHHRSDAFSSIGVLIGIIGARCGLPIMDTIAALIVCVLIIKVAVDIYKQAIKQVTDHSADESIIEQIKELSLAPKEVIKIDDIKTRVHANRIYADIEISVNGAMKLEDAHRIAETIHNNVEHANSKIKHITVHVNPFNYEHIKKEAQ